MFFFNTDTKELQQLKQRNAALEVALTSANKAIANVGFVLEHKANFLMFTIIRADNNHLTDVNYDYELSQFYKSTLLLERDAFLSPLDVFSERIICVNGYLVKIAAEQGMIGGLDLTKDLFYRRLRLTQIS